jgi:hypothetical protein
MSFSEVEDDHLLHGDKDRIRKISPQVGDFIGHYKEVFQTHHHDRVLTMIRKSKFLCVYSLYFPRLNPRVLFEYACQYADFAFALDLRFSIENHPYWNFRPVDYRVMQLDKVCVLSECKKVIDWVLEESQGHFENIPINIQRSAFNARAMLKYHRLITGGIRSTLPPTLETWIDWDLRVQSFLVGEGMDSVCVTGSSGTMPPWMCPEQG